MSAPIRLNADGRDPRPQAEGWVGRQVEAMLRRTLRARFHTIWWEPVAPETLPKGPLVLYANHHTWFDGYLMYQVITRLGIRCVDWITEYHAFPLFGRIGGLPFPVDDLKARSRTMRKTLRWMRTEGRSLVIFPESHLHPGPEILPFGRALEVVCRQVPGVHAIPVALHTELGLHERPEAWIRLGPPLRVAEGDDPHLALVQMGRELRHSVSLRHQVPLSQFEPLMLGTRDVNERWGRQKR